MRSSTSRPVIAALAVAVLAGGVILADQVRQRESMESASLAALVLALLFAARATVVGRRGIAEERAAGQARAERDAALFDQTMELVETERESIAHRLHDGPVQVVAAIRLMADAVGHALDGGDMDRARATLDRLADHAAAMGDDLRRTTARLHPVVMEQLGLLPALETLVSALREEYGTAATLHAPDRRWPASPDRDAALYRIARDAAVSAARSGAAAITIAVRIDDADVELEIRSSGGTATSERAALRRQLLEAGAARVGGALAVDEAANLVAVRAPL
jgi:two-component system sensor histidine kinase UhpB